MKSPPPPNDDPDLTTHHVRAAREGTSTSITWLVERFTPLLLAQARYRMGGQLLGAVDAEDVVQETWAVGLPMLPDLDPRDGRTTPVFLRFLSTTLLQHVNNLMRKQLRRGDVPLVSHDPASPITEVAAAYLKRERRDAVLTAIESLPDRDRDVIVLRAVEGLSNREAANALSESPNACSLRFNRALTRLRETLPHSVFDDL